MTRGIQIKLLGSILVVLTAISSYLLYFKTEHEQQKQNHQKFVDDIKKYAKEEGYSYK